MWSQGYQEVKIRCESCHGSGDARPATGSCGAGGGTCALDANGSPLANVRADAGGDLWLTSRVTGNQHFSRENILASVPEGSRGFFDMARRAVAPYADRLRLLAGEGEAAPGFTALDLPGHTPGHTGFMLDAGGEGLLFWGDLIHSTALQFAEPGWTIAFDADPVQTVATRRRMLDRAVADNLLVTGAHLDFPALGRVLRQGAAYAWQPAPWQFGL